MTAPANPERLWIGPWETDEDRRNLAFDQEKHAGYGFVCSPPGAAPGYRLPTQAYLREDVAAAREAAAEARYKNRDVEVMRVALADLRRIRGCLATRANTLRTIGEEDRAMGLEDAIKQLDEEVFT